MSTKEQPPPSLPKLITLNKGLKLAEQWVKNMRGDVEEAGETEVEGRPSRLGLGAKAPHKSQVGLSTDPVERNLHKRLDTRRRKTVGDEESKISAKDVLNDDSDDDENLDSKTNAFAKKRPAIPATMPQAKKKKK